MGIAGFVTFWMTWDKDVLRPSVFNITKKLTCNKPNDFLIIYLIYPEMESRQVYGRPPKLDMEMYKYAISLK